MHRVLKPFEFFDPGTVDEAVRLLFLHGDKAKVMAGGIDLVLKMRLREIMPEYVVCLQCIPGLNYVEGNKKTGLRFGAMTTLKQLELSPLVQKNWQVLHDAISQIASVQVKNMGTCVGNLCVATPASDIAPALFVLGAKAKIIGNGTEKVIPIEDLFIGVGKTVLEPHEIVTEISIPGLPAGTGSAFMKLAKTADDIAKVNAAVMVTMTDGKCSNARIALGSVAATPIRAAEAEDLLKGKVLNEKIIAKAAEASSEAARPITDVRSTAEYRKQMVKVLIKDGLEKACARAKA